MSTSRRKQLLTDQGVQGELLFRAMVYWFFCLMVVSLLTLALSYFTGPPRPFPQVIRESLVANAPAVFGSVVLLPLVLIDVLKVSNRFVGPIHQIRDVLGDLSAGRASHRVYLRSNDYWHDLANATNRIADELEATRDTAEDIEEDDEDFPCTDQREQDPVAIV